VLQAFTIVISEEDKERLYAEHAAYRTRQQVAGWHADLWDWVRAHGDNIVPTPLAAGRHDSDDEYQARAALAAALLAEQVHLPLFADDRVCQALAFTNWPNNFKAAFSTDHFLAALLKNDVITRDQCADWTLQLIKWRYKFVVPDSCVLKALADRYRDCAPGDLRIVARYVHDSMRDPGLFGGLEMSEPKMPMAFRLYQDWIRVATSFVMSIWRDQTYSDELAHRWTEWATRELFPSPPTVLRLAGVRLATFLGGTVLANAITDAVSIRDMARGNRAIRSLADGLDIDDNQLNSTLGEVLRAI
jgi:hypothetical protein